MLILGMVISVTEAETVWNAFRLGIFSLDQGDTVCVFLLGKGMDVTHIEDEKFDVLGQMQAFVDAKGSILSCGSCLQLRESDANEICPLSTMKDLYDIINESDKLLTF